MNYKVKITEILEGEIEIEAKNLNDAIDQLKGYYDEAGKTIKPLVTEEMTARIFHKKGERRVTLIS